MAASRFQQQGNLDWVALSNSTVSLSVATLSRLSRAGVEQFTLQVGRAICHGLTLPPAAQDRINLAIAQSKKYPSWDNVFWFGFGIKQVITDLADSEEGLALVALCAALSVVYPQTFVAQVLRQMCIDCKAPRELTPALRQWKALVELCMGMLTTSDFLNKLEGFRRIINHRDRSLAICHVPDYKEIAEALIALAEVTRNPDRRITFIGEDECAWLAIFAEWCLDLGVEIQESGKVIYRSSTNFHSVIILRHSASDQTSATNAISIRKVHVIRGGSITSVFPRLVLPSLDQTVAFQTSWDRIFSVTFGRSAEELLTGKLSEHFITVVHCLWTEVSIRDACNGCHVVVDEQGLFFDFDGPQRRPQQNFSENEISLQKEDHRPTHMDFIACLFPEIRQCLARHATSLSKIDFRSEGTYLRKGMLSMEHLRTACHCVKHNPHYPAIIRSKLPAMEICNVSFAAATVCYFRIMMLVSFDNSFQPSVEGLLFLYDSVAQRLQSPKIEISSLPLPKIVELINTWDKLTEIGTLFLALTGRPPSNVNSDLVAVSGAGFCAYYGALSNPLGSIQKLATVHLVQGHLEHEGFPYNVIHAGSGAWNTSKPSPIPKQTLAAHYSPSLDDLRPHLQDLSFEFEVEEMSRHDELRLSIIWRMATWCWAFNWQKLKRPERCLVPTHSFEHCLTDPSGLLENVSGFSHSQCSVSTEAIHNKMTANGQFKPGFLTFRLDNSERVLRVQHIDWPDDFSIVPISFYMGGMGHLSPWIDVKSCLSCAFVSLFKVDPERRRDHDEVFQVEYNNHLICSLFLKKQSPLGVTN